MKKQNRIVKIMAVSAFAAVLGGSPAAFAAYGSGGGSGAMNGGMGTMNRNMNTERMMNSERNMNAQAMDDSAITAKIKNQFMNDSQLKLRDINVETMQGVVKLTGTVETEAEKNKAMELVKKMNGVTSVKDNLLMKEKPGIVSK